MPIQTSCPGCGGPIYVEDRAGMAVCQFCGTRFKVDLEGMAPRLEKDTRPIAPKPEPLPEMAAFDEPKPVEEEWRPPQPEPPDAPYTPPPAFPPKPAPASPANQLFGGRLWLVIALVVGAVTIGSCVCMVLAFKAITGT